MRFSFFVSAVLFFFLFPREIVPCQGWLACSFLLLYSLLHCSRFCPLDRCVLIFWRTLLLFIPVSLLLLHSYHSLLLLYVSSSRSMLSPSTHVLLFLFYREFVNFSYSHSRNFIFTLLFLHSLLLLWPDLFSPFLLSREEEKEANVISPPFFFSLASYVSSLLLL